MCGVQHWVQSDVHPKNQIRLIVIWLTYNTANNTYTLPTCRSYKGCGHTVYIVLSCGHMCYCEACINKSLYTRVQYWVQSDVYPKNQIRLIGIWLTYNTASNIYTLPTCRSYKGCDNTVYIVLSCGNMCYCEVCINKSVYTRCAECNTGFNQMSTQKIKFD